VQLAGMGVFPLRWHATGLPGLAVADSGLIWGVPSAAVSANVLLGFEDSDRRRSAEQTIALVVRRDPGSIFARINERGLWGWFGYVLIGLCEVGFQYGLAIRGTRYIREVLRLHGVKLIRKADGSSALNGPSEAMEEVDRKLRKRNVEERHYKQISYIVLGVAVVGYTIFLLG